MKILLAAILMVSTACSTGNGPACSPSRDAIADGGECWTDTAVPTVCGQLSECLAYAGDTSIDGQDLVYCDISPECVSRADATINGAPLCPKGATCEFYDVLDSYWNNYVD